MLSGSVTGSNDFLEFCESNFFSGKKAIFFLYPPDHFCYRL